MASGRGGPEFVRDANASVIPILQIEHIDAVEQIDEIVAVPGIASLVFGPNDLAGSMGVLGQPEHPKVEAAIDRVIASAHAAGVFIGSGMGAARNRSRRPSAAACSGAWPASTTASCCTPRTSCWPRCAGACRALPLPRGRVDAGRRRGRAVNVVRIGAVGCGACGRRVMERLPGVDRRRSSAATRWWWWWWCRPSSPPIGLAAPANPVRQTPVSWRTLVTGRASYTRYRGNEYGERFDPAQDPVPRSNRRHDPGAAALRSSTPRRVTYAKWP